MKKVLFVLFITLFISSYVLAKDAIYTTADGTKLKCTATKVSGSMEEYNGKIVDNYTFKKNRAYNRNMIEKFAKTEMQKRRPESAPFRTKVKDDKITIREYFTTVGATTTKITTIDRKTGAYYFEAEKKYRCNNFYKRHAAARGKCVIVK